MKSLTLRVFVATLAALGAWMLIEPTAPPISDMVAWESWEGRFLALLGAAIGGGIGATNGFLTGGKVHIARGLILGLVFGVVGVLLGDKLGSLFLNMTLGQNVLLVHDVAQIPRAILGRIIALTPIGALLGLAVGASTLSVKRMKLGFLGGLIAGQILSITSMINPGYAYVMLFAAMTLVLVLRPRGLMGLRSRD